TGQADADRDAEALLVDRARAALLLTLARARLATEREPRLRHGFAQLLDVRQYFLLRPAGEHDRELLAAGAVGTTTAGHVREPRRHHAQHIVADIVTVSIVERLGVVDVDDCDRVRPPQRGACLRQRTTAGPSRNIVA